MKTSVIICEFNPLHTGHKKIIDYAKSISDNVVCVMSGNFTQRGMPAVANKFKRATHAVKAGADLVVELPTIYATASAEDFAFGGVSIATLLNADILVFGSECGQIDLLKKCADLLDDETVNAKIKEYLSQGITYPKAVSLACQTDILDKPNNVLAVEYLRALKKLNSKIIPITISREDNFNSAPQSFASSTALRQEPTQLKTYSFEFVEKDFNAGTEEKYKQFATQLLSVVEREQLEQIADVTEGLHNRIFQADKTHGFEKMMEEIKSKRYTRARLQRVVLNCVLGITKQTVKEIKAQKPHVKVLAVNKDKLQLLAALDNKCDAVTKRADRLYATLAEEPIQNGIIKL